MRIAVASDDGRNVAAHTGRCGGFVVYDLADQAATRVEYRTNQYTAHALGECQGHHDDPNGGHHHDDDPNAAHHSHGPVVAALADCAVLVTRGLGPRLIADLAARGVTTYVCAVESADEAATQFARGLLARAKSGGCCCRH